MNNKAATLSVLCVFLMCPRQASRCAEFPLPAKPPGEFFPLQADAHEAVASFAHKQPIVGTTYFYWYDIHTKAHIIDGDGSDALTTHPADMNGISYKSVAWHRGQLEDMVSAGIDFLMPVYWGVPGQYDGWSFVGLGPLVEAHTALQAQGVKPPAIGMFYDTSILQYNSSGPGGRNYHVDLATDFGKHWFYTAIRDFFSLIPPAKWARVDGRPIIFLYSHTFAKDQDPKQLEYVRGRFERDFGVQPFIVKSDGWLGEADAVYSWGGAVNGPLIYRDVAALGPGYDHSAVPGRSPLVVERKDGETYVERWRKLLQLDPQRRPWMVHVETWNEWHEGTDVAHSREYGRSYIVLTRLFADLWHAGTAVRLPNPYGDSVSWEPDKARGLSIRPSGGDGFWETTLRGQAKAVVTAPNPHSRDSRYLYFDVDDAYAYDLYEQTITVEVTYYDGGCASFGLEYDNVDPNVGPREGAFRPTREAAVTGGQVWKTAKFVLPQCRFMNRCNGADFRLAVVGGDLQLCVRKVVLAR